MINQQFPAKEIREFAKAKLATVFAAASAVFWMHLGMGSDCGSPTMTNPRKCLLKQKQNKANIKHHNMTGPARKIIYIQWGRAQCVYK